MYIHRVLSTLLAVREYVEKSTDKKCFYYQKCEKRTERVISNVELQ